MCKVNSPLYGQRSLVVGRPVSAGEAHWVPNTDVYVADGQLVIQVELAGMRRSDLELIVEGNRLMICGQRPDGSRGPKCKFLVMEINYGPFECVFEILPVFTSTRPGRRTKTDSSALTCPRRCLHPPKPRLSPSRRADRISAIFRVTGVSKINVPGEI